MAEPQATKTDDKSSAQDVSDYLTNATKKKRKSYAVCAFGINFDSQIAAGIVGHIKTTYPQLVLAQPKNVEEFKKQFVRDINLIVIDDEFVANQVNTLEAVRALKEKKIDHVPPTLFLTRQPESLVKQYNVTMSQFHEADDYIQVNEVPLAQVFNRIKTTVEGGTKRRSRRYRTDFLAQITILGQPKPMDVTVVDISIHGIQVRSNVPIVFRTNEQMIVSLNMGGIVLSVDGEFLKVSGRVRRVMIGGNVAGISFEYLSIRQLRLLTEFLGKLLSLGPLKKSASSGR